jgi:hypothetical protein
MLIFERNLHLFDRCRFQLRSMERYDLVDNFADQLVYCG